MKSAIQKLGILFTSFYLSTQKALASNLDSLLPRPGEDTFEGSDIESPELSAVGNLPEVSVEGAVTVIIRTILAWAIIITLITIVVTGIFFIKAEGDEEKITKARSMLVFLVIGMLIMSAAYGIVAGVIQLQLFQ